MTRTRFPLAASLLLAATLLAPGPSAAGDDAVVLDGRGHPVGAPIAGAADPSARFGLDAASLAWVEVPVEGAPTRLLLGESGPWDTKDLEPLRFESADCTGDALLAGPAATDAPRPAAIFDTMVFLPAGAAREHVVRSEGWPQRDGDACDAEQVSPRFCCAPLARARTVQASPVAVLDLTALGLAGPFRIEP